MEICWKTFVVSFKNKGKFTKKMCGEFDIWTDTFKVSHGLRSCQSSSWRFEVLKAFFSGNCGEFLWNWQTVRLSTSHQNKFKNSLQSSPWQIFWVVSFQKLLDVFINFKVHHRNSPKAVRFKITNMKKKLFIHHKPKLFSPSYHET